MVNSFLFSMMTGSFYTSIALLVLFRGLQAKPKMGTPELNISFTFAARNPGPVQEKDIAPKRLPKYFACARSPQGLHF
jgi:hypothetical protein